MFFWIVRSHNKALKFVPALRASTGRVLRTRRLTETLCLQGDPDDWICGSWYK